MAMKIFKKWLQSELDSMKTNLENIPLDSRKGIEVAMLRKRAREVDIAIQLLLEFEAVSLSHLGDMGNAHEAKRDCPPAPGQTGCFSPYE